MKLYPLIFLFSFFSCESNSKLLVEKHNTGLNDSTMAKKESMQPVVETSRTLTHEQQLKYLTDTITVTTKQNYYNRNYALTINEFTEDIEKTIGLLQAGKYLNKWALKKA